MHRVEVMKNEILRLRSEGKTYNEIVAILGCSKGTVSYHCNQGRKVKSRYNQQIRKNRPTRQEDRLFIESEITAKSKKNQERLSLIIERMKNGKSFTEIAKELNLVEKTIKRILRKNGVSFSKRQKISPDATEKICPKCNLLKPITSFGVNRTRRQSYCKICANHSAKKWFKETKQDNKRYRELLDRPKLSLKKIRDEVSKLKSDKGCVRCGEKDSACLDYHHLRDKTFNVSTLCAKKNREKIYEEIEKCVVICANCHRKLHAGRFEIEDFMDR